MRKIKFNELKLKDINDEEIFYQSYLNNLQDNIIKSDTSLQSPVKQYEIFYLDILGGKIILLNKNYIESDNITNQELFYDYQIALKIYNLMLDIVDGINDEKNEINELYKDERLQKSEEIEKLKDQDKNIFKKKQEEYNIIINSEIYKSYSKLKDENEKLKNENKRLTEEINNFSVQQNNKVSLFQKLINKFKNKRLPMN